MQRLAKNPSIVRLRFSLFLLSLFFLSNISGVLYAANTAKLSEEDIQNCMEGVDRSVYAYAHHDIIHARKVLNELSAICTGFPQLHHNLGVLEALSENWAAAIEQLQLSVQSDSRAAESVNALNTIFRYRAAIAYQRALNTSVKAPRPVLSMQNSTVHNADRYWSRKATAYLRSVSTVEYELFDWWTANQDGSTSASYAHYATEYPQPINTTDFKSDWDSVEKDITFTTTDAVVVLSYKRKEQIQHTQLLLRLQGARWKIYRETSW